MKNDSPIGAVVLHLYAGNDSKALTFSDPKPDRADLRDPERKIGGADPKPSRLRRGCGGKQARSDEVRIPKACQNRNLQKIPVFVSSEEGECVKKTKSRKRLILILILIPLLLIAAVGAWAFLSGSYRADRTAVAALKDTSSDIEIRAREDRIDFVPREAQAGLIFYPGGKVEFGAYAPLMKACAERGILCVLLHMPGDLAVLDYNAADGVAAEYPEIERWYVGGHSLGGSIAATYAKKHAHALTGLVMLAAYSTDDLTGTELQVLSVYGTEDGVLNRERYDSLRDNLPADTV